MEFMVDKKKVVLRGSPQPRLQMIQGKSLVKALQLPPEMCKVQLCSLMVIDEELNKMNTKLNCRIYLKYSRHN